MFRDDLHWAKTSHASDELFHELFPSVEYVQFRHLAVDEIDLLRLRYAEVYLSGFHSSRFDTFDQLSLTRYLSGR